MQILCPTCMYLYNVYVNICLQNLLKASKTCFVYLFDTNLNITIYLCIPGIDDLTVCLCVVFFFCCNYACIKRFLLHYFYYSSELCKMIKLCVSLFEMNYFIKRFLYSRQVYLNNKRNLETTLNTFFTIFKLNFSHKNSINVKYLCTLYY